LGHLTFLGKELRNVSIYAYPIIIFEFMTGYYTTEKLFKKNRELGFAFSKDFEIMEIPKEFMKPTRTTMAPGQIKSSEANNKLQNSLLPIIKEQKSENIPSTEEQNKSQKEAASSIKPSNTIIGTNIFNENPLAKNEKRDMLSKSVLPSVSTKKKNLSLSVIDKKYSSDSRFSKAQAPKYGEYIRNLHVLDFYIKPQEKIKDSNSNFEKDIGAFKEGLEKYKRKLRILEMDKQIKFLTKKNEAIKELTKDLEEAIKHKKQNLENVSNQLKPHQVNYNNKLNQLKSNLNGRGQYQLVYDSFVYQKMAEVCFVFFNNKIQSLYTIPKFYAEPISNNDSKMERLEYYNSDKKNISAMMGHICQMMIYLSKTFNIPLRFPIFLNGSKSYILKSVKENKEKIFLPLYLDAKKDDKHGNFENALNCLKDDIKEIFNFLSMFPEIISKEDNKNVNDMNGKYLFFFFFVIFNHALFRFMKTLQTAV
jgi:hypothetical protein